MFSFALQSDMKERHCVIKFPIVTEEREFMLSKVLMCFQRQ